MRSKMIVNIYYLHYRIIWEANSLLFNPEIKTLYITVEP